MKELKKLAVILRALGITANVVSDTITCNEEVISENTFCECLKGSVRFDVWHDDEFFELHFTFKNTLVYDTLYLDTLVSVVSEITSTITKFEG
nr:MAG TPA: hypothetical protein [Caudoviricetes sp.]